MKLDDQYNEDINDTTNDQNNNDRKVKDQNEVIVSKQKKYINNLNKSLSMQLSLSQKNLSTSKLKTPLNCLLGSFEESLLNGRMNPVGVVDGFYAEIGASGSFFPEHATLPVYAAFYQVCEDIAASPYLGVINLSSLSGSKRGYRVPNKGTIQVTLFNPNNTVVKMFVVMYDLSDMPANHRTFIRQRTMYVPVISSSTNPTTTITSTNSSTNLTTITQEDQNMKSFLRYLIHLR